MIKLIKTVCLIFIFSNLYSQENYNLELLANVDLGESGNDIWGYVDDNGIEYAVIGSRNGTSIYSLEDPSNPILRYKAEGSSSLWRDIKSYKDRLYVTCDSGDDGLVIINMEGAPENISHIFWKPTFPELDSNTVLRTTHNLYIDKEGYCYLSGTNISNRGIVILDLNQDPDLPVYLSSANLAYSHDVYVNDNLMVTSEIYQGVFGLYDVTDKTNPILINTQETTTLFTHNAWFSDDNNFVFTTDEKPNAFVESYDISDPNNIKRLDRFQPLETRNLGVIPHNTHYKDGFLITSWYTDGIVIIDANRPDNLIEVGSYDTFLGPDGDFNGCWGAFPFLPSGLVLGSDLNSGLYILRPNKTTDGTIGYNRACYLEGNITSKADGTSVSGVNIEIVSSKLNEEFSNQNGDYKTGLATAGTYEVNITHPAYLPFSATVELINGEVTILNAELEQYVVAGNTVLNEDNSALPNVKVSFYNEENNVYIETESDENGNFNVGLQPNTNYEIFAGAWGFRNYYEADYTSDNSSPVVLKLLKGYQDNFNVDLGWTVSGNASTGQWERAVPNTTVFQGNFANANGDDPNDVGTKCYLTGNIGGDAPTDDIDNGATILRSPKMIFENADSMTIQYKYWFVNTGGSGVPNDALVIYLTNGITEIVVETINSTNYEWSELKTFEFTPNDIEFTNEMSLIAYASDDDPGHLLECGLDAFAAEGFYFTSGTKEVKYNELFVFPNPVASTLFLNTYFESSKLNIQDINGRQVLNINNFKGKQIDVSDLTPGLYTLQIEAENGNIYTNKIIKI